MNAGQCAGTGLHAARCESATAPCYMCGAGEAGLSLGGVLEGADAPPCLTGQREGLLTLFDHMATCTALCTLDGVLLHANRAFRSVLRDLRDRRHVLPAVRGLAVRLRDVPSAIATCEGEYPATLRGTRLGEVSVHDCGALAAVVVEPHSAGLVLRQKTGEQPQLTSREREVAVLLARGLSTKAIARDIGVSWCTARNHVARTMRKLGVSSRAQVAAMVVSGMLGNVLMQGMHPAESAAQPCEKVDAQQPSGSRPQ
jgi:DNA-binding CsgD family transcriptional regulator